MNRTQDNADVVLTNNSLPPRSRELNIVAHPDDDLLFMNPDIMTSIRERNTVRTIYLTAMIATDEDDYWRHREMGIKAAYAFMAGVGNHWDHCQYALTGHVLHLERLRAAPQVSLVFLRLPDSADPRPRITTLRTLDNAKSDTLIESVDGRSRYTRDQLRHGLTGLIADFKPSVIRLQDWQTTEDYDRDITNPAAADHPDHIRTVVISRQAVSDYEDKCQTLYYRNYNISYDPPNLAPDVARLKRAIFLRYVDYDSLIGGDEQRTFSSPFSTYEPWLERQYRVPQ
jgi:LmbE family N-acetylglucosaminyl deacetylase